jgi:hypothetical protein
VFGSGGAECAHAVEFGVHTEAFALQIQPEQIRDRLLVFDDEDQSAFTHRSGVAEGEAEAFFPSPAACITFPATAPTTTNPTPAQNIGQFPRTTANVPTVNAMVMMTTAAQAAGVEP